MNLRLWGEHERRSRPIVQDGCPAPGRTYPENDDEASADQHEHSAGQEQSAARVGGPSDRGSDSDGGNPPDRASDDWLGHTVGRKWEILGGALAREPAQRNFDALQGQPIMPESQGGSVQRSMEAALSHVPGTRVAFVAFPGITFSSPHHHTFFLFGSEPLTSQMRQPVLVDARTEQVTAAPKLGLWLST